MSTLEVYIERADRELEEQEWLLYAREGGEAAVAAWEREAVLLYETAEGLSRGRHEVEQLVAGEIDDRFTEWILRRFFEKLPAASLAPFHAAVQAQNLAFLYRTTDGRIDVELETGDPLLKPADGLETDRESWRAGARAGVEEVLASWRASLEASAPELLAAIPAAKREAASAMLVGYGERCAEGLHRELDALFAQEESGFVARRLSDSYSLRRKSEQATAQAVVSRLILETKEQTAEGIRALEAGLQVQPDAPAGTAEIEAEAWQRSFAAALEAGLATWDAAEEKLLVERVEWETRAGRDYSDGERAWAAAYESLRTERARWEGDIRKILAAGEEQWRERQGELAEAIGAAAAELEREMQSRAASKSEEIENLVDMYAQASAMIATALDSGGYWLEKIKVSLRLDAPYADIQRAARVPTDGSTIEEVLEQVRYWQGVLAAYTGHVDAARARLASVYALTLDDDGQEDPLRAILACEDPGGAYLDEYQVELLKVKAVAEYWEAQYAIAEAVDRYARDLGSGRATEAQSEASYRDALAGYAAGKAAYDAAVLRLEEAGALLAGREDAIQDAMALVRQERAALEKARTDYDTLFALYASGGGEFFASQLRDRYRTLLDLMGFGEEEEGTLGGVMAEYLHAARRYGFESAVSLAASDIALLVKGQASGQAPAGESALEFPSLAALRQAVARLRVPAPDAIPAVSEELGIPVDHPYRALLDELLAAHASATGLEEQFWGRQCILLAQKIRGEAETALENREQAIRLLSCVDGSSWYRLVTGRDLAAGLEVGEALFLDKAVSAGAYLQARAWRELEGLARWEQWRVSGMPAALETNADHLAFALRAREPGLGSLEADARSASLQKLIAFLSEGLDLSARREDLRGLLRDEPWLAGFVGGQGSFTLLVAGSPIDCNALGMSEEWKTRERAAGSWESWRRYADSAPGLASERVAEGREALAAVLGKAGLLEEGGEGADGTLRLKSPAALAEALPVMDASGREQWLSNIAADLMQAEALLPAWLSEQVQGWFAELVSYAAAAAACGGPHPAAGSTAEAAGIALDSLSREREQIADLRGQLADAADPIVGLADLYETLKDAVPGTGALGEAAAAGLTTGAVADRLTRAAAVAVASRVLGSGDDPGLEGPWDAAFSACFLGADRAPAELKQGIVDRARGLLGIQRALDGHTSFADMTAIERQAYAYALWNSGAIECIGDGLAVSEQAGAIHDLRALIDGGAAEGEIDAWEAGLPDEAARGAVHLVRERLASSLPEQRDGVFLSALLAREPATGDESARQLALRIQECRRLAPVGGEVLERALCLDLAVQLGVPNGEAILGLIKMLTGLESHGLIDPAAFGNRGYDVQRAALSGLSADALPADPLASDALAFLIKKTSLAGRDVSGLIADLEGAPRGDADTFLGFLGDLRGYLPGVDENEGSYARGLPGERDADDVGSYISALRTGVWDDLVFTASLGVGSAPSGFLGVLSGLETGGLGRGATLIGLAGEYLGGFALTFADQHCRLAAVKAYRGSYEAALASTAEDGEGGYREYLVTGNLTAKNEEDSLASALASAANLTDAVDIAHCESADPIARSLENGVLEAHNRLSRAGDALEGSFEPDDEAATADLERIEAFAQAMGKFTRTEDPVSIWAEADGAPVPAEVIVEYESTRGALESTLNAVGTAQAEIARLGSALETWMSAVDAEPDSTGVREARESLEAAQGELQLAIEEFRSASEAYDAVYRTARGAYADLETARFERDKQQEIHEYAANGYLRASGDQTNGAVAWLSPAQQLERVQDRRDRARAALAALEGAIDAGLLARSSTDGEYLEAIGLYRDALERYLSLKKVHGDLVAEIARQEAVVDDQEEEFYRIAGEIMRGDSTAYTSEDPLVTAAALESALDPSSPDNEYNGLAIAYFCRLEGDARLRLAYDPASYILEKNTDWTALKVYMSGQEEEGQANEEGEGEAGQTPTFQKELRQWIVDMDALLGGSSDPAAILGRWGLAAGYVKQRLHDANMGSADIAAQAAGKAFADEAATEMVGSDGYLSAFLSTNHDQTLDLNCTAFIRAEGAQALAALKGTELELFRFYLAMDALGGTAERGASFFRDSSMLAVWKYLDRKLTESAAAHASTGRNLAEIGAVLWTVGTVLNVFPGLGIAVLIEASFVLGMAVYELNEAQKYQPILADARSRLSGANSYGAAVAGSASNLAADVGSGNDALARLHSEQAALAGLKGPGWDEKPAEGEFVQALTRMYGAELDPDLRASIGRYFGDVDRLAKTPSDILSAMIHASDRDEIAASQALESEERRAREAQAAATEKYRGALQALLEGAGPPDVQALLESAAKAFARPSFVQEGHGRSLYTLQADLALEPPATGNREYEAARGEVLAGLKDSLTSLYQQRLQSLAAVRQAEWALKQEDLARARAAWGEKMSLVVSRSTSEWDKADGRFKAELAQWRTGFADEYQRKSLQWNEVLLGFQEAKGHWVEDTALEAARAGDESILAEVGQSASTGAREMASRIVTGISYEPPDGERLLARLVPGESLGVILDGARQSTDRIASGGIEVSRGLGMTGGFASSLALIRGFLTEESEELAKRGTLIVADQARESLREAREGYTEFVQDANEGFEAGMDRMFLAAGYGKEAGRYRREGIIGSTVLSGTVTERQDVAGYTPFLVPSFEVKTGLAADDLVGLSAEGIHARLSVALEELEDQREEIFGPDDETDAEKAARKKSFQKQDFTIDPDDGFIGEMWEGVMSAFGEKEFGYTLVEQSWGAGSFGSHIGYAPVFVGAPDPDKAYAENVLEPGSGQLDHLIGWYAYYEMRVGKGLGELNAPVYDKPLWNDEGGFVEAPTLRAVVDLGVSIAATLTGNVWVTAALSLTDDALFGLADIAGGYKEGSAVALEFGKKAVLGFGTAAIGGVFGTNDVFGKTFGFDAWLGIGEKNIIGQTLLAGTQAFTSNALSGAVNAISYSGQDGWGWDSRVFAESTVGRGAVAGYLGSMTSTAVGGLLDTQMQGFVRDTYARGVAFDRFAGSLVGLGVNYAIAGEATVNLLNFDMFGATKADGTALSHGLLELHLGGEDGFKARLGSGGTDMSIGTIARALSGLQTWRVNSQLESATQEEARKYVMAMRTLVSTGRESDALLFEDILSGRADIEETFDVDGVAETIFGDGGRRKIFLRSGAESSAGNLALGVILSHEGYRNGADDGSEGQQIETDLAVLGHSWTAFDLENTYGSGILEGLTGAGAAAFRQAMTTGDWSSFASLAGRFETRGDNWLMTKTGRLINDNRTGLLQELADGTWVRRVGDDQEQSVAAALVHYLGAARARTLLNREYGDPFNRGDLTGEVSIYNDQTLRDVLCLDDLQISAARQDPKEWERILASATALQKDRLLGETLMKGNGIFAKGNDWVGGGYGFTFSDNRFGDGMIGIRRVAEGEYEKFIVSATAWRSANAFGVLGWQNGKWIPQSANNRNTSISFVKTDLDGNELGRYDTGQIWSTVDNAYGQFPNTVDQDMNSLFLGHIQGNTVNSDSVIRMIDYDSGIYGVDKLFLIAGGKTIAGTQIDNGRIAGPDGRRFLWHPGGVGTVDGCWAAMNGEGFTPPKSLLADGSWAKPPWADPKLPGSGASNFQQLTDFLQNEWGVYSGLSMTVTLVNSNRWAWTGFRWWDQQ
jgi:hypothetical protein